MPQEPRYEFVLERPSCKRDDLLRLNNSERDSDRKVSIRKNRSVGSGAAEYAASDAPNEPRNRITQLIIDFDVFMEIGCPRTNAELEISGPQGKAVIPLGLPKAAVSNGYSWLQRKEEVHTAVRQLISRFGPFA